MASSSAPKTPTMHARMGWLVERVMVATPGSWMTPSYGGWELNDSKGRLLLSIQPAPAADPDATEGRWTIQVLNPEARSEAQQAVGGMVPEPPKGWR